MINVLKKSDGQEKIEENLTIRTIRDLNAELDKTEDRSKIDEIVYFIQRC